MITCTTIISPSPRSLDRIFYWRCTELPSKCDHSQHVENTCRKTIYFVGLAEFSPKELVWSLSSSLSFYCALPWRVGRALIKSLFSHSHYCLTFTTPQSHSIKLAQQKDPNDERKDGERETGIVRESQTNASAQSSTEVLSQAAK